MPKKNRLESFGSRDGSLDGAPEESSVQQTHPQSHLRWTVGETEHVLSGDALKAVIDDIEWVRLVLHQDQVTGIGYHHDRLVHLLATGEVGLIRRVSAVESVKVLCDLAEMEQEELPDIESSAGGWLKWLTLLSRQF